MRLNNIWVKLGVRIGWVLIALVAFVMTFYDHSAKNGDGIATTLFFTTWSVWLSCVAAIWCLTVTIIKVVNTKVKNYPDDYINNECPVIKFCANIMMIATFIISAFVLDDKIWEGDWWTVGSTFKHFLLPIITIADAVMFDRKKQYRVSYPFFGVVIPLIYWFVVIVRFCAKRSEYGHIIRGQWKYYYPYGFTNLDNGHTLGGLIGMLAGICVGLILVGFIFWIVSKIDPKAQKVFDTGIDNAHLHDCVYLVDKKLHPQKYKNQGKVSKK